MYTKLEDLAQTEVEKLVTEIFGGEKEKKNDEKTNNKHKHLDFLLHTILGHPLGVGVYKM